jgi:RNA polymerase sigma factor (TIGR02999 family)
MGAAYSHEITGLLKAWTAGDEKSLEPLMSLVYAELRRTAHRYMVGEHAGHTLQTTALVHEVYLRLVDVKQVNWQDRTHFMAICARLMRRVLVDLARSKQCQKRGTGHVPLSLEEVHEIGSSTEPDLVALDAALDRLARFDERKGKVVELRFFGGLSVEESAEVLKVSPETVMRDWKMAKVWLLRELDGGTRERRI